jgi:hypothetical protein
LHPHVARERLQSGVRHALSQMSGRRLLPIYASPVRVEVTFLTADMAASCAIIRGVECPPERPRVAVCTGTDLLEVFRAFVGMIQITRALVE